MSQFNICCMSRYTIGDHSNPKHNITKSMVGPFPLAPHHDYLQHMCHVYLMQMGLKSGCYNCDIDNFKNHFSMNLKQVIILFL